tara:strand:+ start:595 stop:804 length:210 start_codon:yes stop_codon:yes gene_type:complete
LTTSTGDHWIIVSRISEWLLIVRTCKIKHIIVGSPSQGCLLINELYFGMHNGKKMEKGRGNVSRQRLRR